MRPSPVTTPAAVSSHDVSTPRMSSKGLGLSDRTVSERIPPHDERVLPVVGVVAAPQAARLEPEGLVEGNRGGVGDANLERVAAPRVSGRQLEELVQEPARDADAPPARVYGEVHDVPGVHIAGDDQVRDESARVRVE